MKPHLEMLDPELQGLLEDFYNLVGIKICVYDADGNELSFYPDRFTPFCGLLRSDIAMDKRCRECDESAIKRCKATKEAYIYTCHAGLTECIAPIIVNDKVLGYIAIGQIRQQEESDFLTVNNDEKLKQFYHEMPIVENSKIVSALHIVQVCAYYKQFKKFLLEATYSFSARFEQYVREHLKECLDISVLMKEFRLSRRDLYQSVERAFSYKPAEYVKEQRLQYAYRLAQETSLSVTQIAEECGIYDYNYFSKQFKKRFKKSVRELRKLK